MLWLIYDTRAMDPRKWTTLAQCWRTLTGDCGPYAQHYYNQVVKAGLVLE